MPRWDNHAGARLVAATSAQSHGLHGFVQGLREELVDGNYALVLEFANKKGMNAEQWEHWRPKFGTFFGPGITAQARRPRSYPLLRHAVFSRRGPLGSTAPMCVVCLASVLALTPTLH